MNKYDDDDVG